MTAWLESGIKITVTDRGRFQVAEDKDYPSLEDARKAAAGEAKRQALKPMNEKVWLPDGTTAILEGVHGNTGDWKFKSEAGERLFSGYNDHRPQAVYYPDGWAWNLLQQKAVKEAQIKALDEQLEAYKITLPQSPGRPTADMVVAMHGAVLSRIVEIETAVENDREAADIDRLEEAGDAPL